MHFRWRVFMASSLTLTGIIILIKHYLTATNSQSQQITTPATTHETQQPTTKYFYGNPSLAPNNSFFVPRKEEALLLSYTFPLDGSQICRGEEPYLVIFILSLHDKTTQRTAIRQTWGSVAQTGRWPSSSLVTNIKIVFLFGINRNAALNEIVKQENQVHHDIVVGSFIDTYSNLTLKVLMGFKWMTKFCPQAKYVMKTDEDCFPVLPKLVNKIKYLNDRKILCGFYSFSEGVYRRGKSAVDNSSYPLWYYPPHCKGILYVMSSKMARDILKVSSHFKYVRMEDVHITGILAKALDARHVWLRSSEYHMRKAATPCELHSGSVLLSQLITHVKMYQIWNIVQNPVMCL